MTPVEKRAFFAQKVQTIAEANSVYEQDISGNPSISRSVKEPSQKEGINNPKLRDESKPIIHVEVIEKSKSEILV